MVASVQVCLDPAQRVFTLISAMAGMAETAVDQTIQGLLTGDIRLAETLLQRESVINHMEMHIDGAILAQLALGSQETVHTYRDYVFRKICERLGSGSP